MLGFINGSERGAEYRSRHLAAVVLALIRQTVRDKDLAENLICRIQGLTEDDGHFYEARATPLLDLLTEVLAVGGERVYLDGPDIVLNEIATRSLRLVFHELLTNALKHGALSASAGRLTVVWKMHKSLVVDWCERDGPRVAPPMCRKFGLKLMPHMLSKVGGTVAPEYLETGYRYRLVIPLVVTQ